MPNTRPPTRPALSLPYTILYWQWQYRVKVNVVYRVRGAEGTRQRLHRDASGLTRAHPLVLH